MKKLLCMVVACVLGLGLLCACGNNSAGGDEEKRNIHGTFYTLEEAYEDELLTIDDLKSIAQDLNSNNPVFDYTDQIDGKIEAAITKDYALLENAKRPASQPKLRAYDVLISEYYGVYHGCYAVRVQPRNTGYIEMMRWEYIEDVEFIYPCGPSIVVWVES